MDKLDFLLAIESGANEYATSHTDETEGQFVFDARYQAYIAGAAKMAKLIDAPDLLAENKRLRDLVRQMLDDIKTDMAHSVGDQYGNFPNGEPEFIDRLEWAKNASAIFNEQ